MLDSGKPSIAGDEAERDLLVTACVRGKAG